MILIVLGCSTTSHIYEIKELSKTRFDSLSIQPDVELYDFRIDIIRQTTDHSVNDSTNPLEDESFYQGNQSYYLEDDGDYLG